MTIAFTPLSLTLLIQNQNLLVIIICMFYSVEFFVVNVLTVLHLIIRSLKSIYFNLRNQPSATINLFLPPTSVRYCIENIVYPTRNRLSTFQLTFDF